MNQFERVAIFTAIEGIEAQLRGVKALIAAASGAPQGKAETHKTTSTLSDFESHELSDEEDQKLQAQLLALREKQMRGMVQQAEDIYTEALREAAGGVPPQNPAAPPPGQSMSELNG